MTEDRNSEEDTRQNAEEDLKGTTRRRLLKRSLFPDEFQVCSFRAQLAMTGGAFQIGFSMKLCYTLQDYDMQKRPNITLLGRFLLFMENLTGLM